METTRTMFKITDGYRNIRINNTTNEKRIPVCWTEQTIKIHRDTKNVNYKTSFRFHMTFSLFINSLLTFNYSIKCCNETFFKLSFATHIFNLNNPQDYFFFFLYLRTAINQSAVFMQDNIRYHREIC